MNRKHNPDNERIKYKYFAFLEQAKRQDQSTVDAIAKAISRFEDYTKYRCFKAFHFEQAIGFKAYLAKQINAKTGKPLSMATMNSTLRPLKAFFQWLSREPGYKSRINYSDAEYFNLSEKGVRVANAKREQPVPTLEQIKQVLAVMPKETDIELRNRALVAFTLLSGARDSAITSLKLKHVNLEAGYVFQDAREVKTKASKTIMTYFFPVGDDVLEIFRSWVFYLRNDLLFGNDDPLFPKTKVGLGENGVFSATGLTREHWSTASPIRELFRKAFDLAGLPYFNPHSFRNTLATLGEQVCGTPEVFKAWSQNYGHERVMTTFNSYGEVPLARQAEIFQGLRSPKPETKLGNVEEFAEAVARAIERKDQIIPTD